MVTKGSSQVVEQMYGLHEGSPRVVGLEVGFHNGCPRGLF